jgi:Holliday junction resolvasome RuvABC endonuclease subunit
VPEPPDVADALAVAVCHYYLGRGEQDPAEADEDRAATGK